MKQSNSKSSASMDSVDTTGAPLHSAPLYSRLKGHLTIHLAK